jgi:hypothetical protein
MLNRHKNARLQDSAKNQIGISRVAYTPMEFAALFGRTMTWTYRQLYRGEISAVRIGGRLMIPAGEVDKLVNGEPVDFSARAEVAK